MQNCFMTFSHRIVFLIFVGTTLLITGCGPEPGPEGEESASAPPTEDVGQDAPAGGTLVYPETARVEQMDDYHGTTVADPYRWLEDDVRVNEDVQAWVEAQNAVTHDYLGTIEERDAIKARLTELWNYEKFGVPEKVGGYYYFSRNDGLQNQNVVFRQANLDGEPELVVDPNTWSGDGTVALAGFEVSPDGRHAALAVQDGGSDWRTVRILDLETGALSGDEVSWMKFSPISWAKDSTGFYYARYPAPVAGDEFQTLNHNQQVWFHQIGTSQDDDRLVYTRPDHPDWGFSPVVTDDGSYLVMTIWKGTDSRYQVAVQRLDEPDQEPQMLVEGFDHDYTFVGNIGSRFFFRTDLDAPRGRLISVDVDDPDRGWTEIIPERDAVLEGLSHVGGHFVASYLRDARSEIRIHDSDGSLVREVDLPGIGSASGFGGDADDPETFYMFSSFNAPPTLYHYDVTTGASNVFKQASVDFDPTDYVVRQVFYDSLDGTRVPMFIAHRKGIDLDGNNPTLLYGYGGFSISVRPAFSITRLAWMEMGGVYAVANLRGGGEYGKEWHQAGTKLDKQNVFDDFIAAGEYLVAENYTRPERLAILGGSNGGLLVGAVVNQRPDLFGAAIPAVGVMDMLRFDQFTAGRFWVDDYGSSGNPEEFAVLYAYSPYHNLEDGTDYPAVLVTTADTDDRVVPGHSFKYAARLQAAQGGTDPVLIRIQTRAGHGSGKPTSVQIQETADMWAFLAENLDMTLPDTYGQETSE